MSSSSVRSRPQFRTWVGQASNLDRCVRCSAPRSSHGADWRCPEPLTSSTSAALSLIGVVLAGGALLVHAGVGSGFFAVESAVFLVGVSMIIAGLTSGGR